MNNAFAYATHGARIPTSVGTEIQQNLFFGPVSTIMRSIKQREGDLSTYFDIRDEIENMIDITSLKQVFIHNHTEPNRRLIEGHLLLEDIFGFYKSFRKIAKELGFELELQISNRKQDIRYTRLGDSIVDVTINSILLNIPSKISSPEAQRFFN